MEQSKPGSIDRAATVLSGANPSNPDVVIRSGGIEPDLIVRQSFIPDNAEINTATLNYGGIGSGTFDEALEAELNEKDRIYQECVQHPLFPVYMAAIEQAMYGKGERHGGGKTPFFDQPWVHYQRMHGRGFLTGQSSKKLEEAAHQREGKPFIDEVLGAIVYAGMAVLREQGDVK